MNTIYRVSFYCHGCRLENSFTFTCWGDDFAAAKKAGSFSCPSGCNPNKSAFEIVRLADIVWEEAFQAADAVFH